MTKKSRSRKPIVSTTYMEIKGDMSRHGLILTNQQIDRFYQLCPPSVQQDIRAGHFDTYDREHFLDALVRGIMGPDYHWPINGEVGSHYSNTFPNQFRLACAKHGIKFQNPPSPRIMHHRTALK